MFKYGMKSRGFSIGAQPNGVEKWEDTNKRETGFWSYIYYEEPLTDDLIKKYELKFLGEEVK